MPPRVATSCAGRHRTGRGDRQGSRPQRGPPALSARNAVHSKALAKEAVNRRILRKEAALARAIAPAAVTADAIAPGSIHGGALGTETLHTVPITDIDEVAENGKWTAGNTEDALCGPGEALLAPGFVFTNPGNREVAWLEARPFLTTDGSSANGVSGRITSIPAGARKRSSWRSACSSWGSRRRGHPLDLHPVPALLLELDDQRSPAHAGEEIVEGDPEPPREPHVCVEQPQHLPVLDPADPIGGHHRPPAESFLG